MTEKQLRALDGEVARKVFGWTDAQVRQVFAAESGSIADCHNCPELPHYSTDIAAAWLVVEWLRERCGTFDLVAGLQWHCCREALTPSHKGWGAGETAPLAICEAALLAVAEVVL